jgi:hypothetical protein
MFVKVGRLRKAKRLMLPKAVSTKKMRRNDGRFFMDYLIQITINKRWPGLRLTLALEPLLVAGFSPIHTVVAAMQLSHQRGMLASYAFKIKKMATNFISLYK